MTKTKGFRNPKNCSKDKIEVSIKVKIEIKCSFGNQEVDNTGEHGIKPIIFYSFGRESLVSLKEGNVLKFF
jgi:hypothetical protein